MGAWIFDKFLNVVVQPQPPSHPPSLAGLAGLTGCRLAVIYSDLEEPETRWQANNCWDFIVARQPEWSRNVLSSWELSQGAELLPVWLELAAPSSLQAQPGGRGPGQARPPSD